MKCSFSPIRLAKTSTFYTAPHRCRYGDKSHLPFLGERRNWHKQYGSINQTKKCTSASISISTCRNFSHRCTCSLRPLLLQRCYYSKGRRRPQSPPLGTGRKRHGPATSWNTTQPLNTVRQLCMRRHGARVKVCQALRGKNGMVMLARRVRCYSRKRKIWRHQIHAQALILYAWLSTPLRGHKGYTENHGCL